MCVYIYIYMHIEQGIFHKSSWPNEITHKIPIAAISRGEDGHVPLATSSCSKQLVQVGVGGWNSGFSSELFNYQRGVEHSLCSSWILLDFVLAHGLKPSASEQRWQPIH